MADEITDPRVRRFTNEKLRRLAEHTLAVEAIIDIISPEYTNTVAPLIANNADTDEVDDGSPEDGRNVITKADIATAVTGLAAVKAALTPAVVLALNKLAVRPLRVSIEGE